MRAALYISFSCVALLGCDESTLYAGDDTAVDEGIELRTGEADLGSGHIDGDVVAPSTTIISGPDYRSLDEVVTFTFAADEPASFECSVDGGRYQACVSPQEYPQLDTGSHSFRVYATDEWGNREAIAAKWSWQSCFETNALISAAAAVTMCHATGHRMTSANRLAAYVNPDSLTFIDTTGWTGYDLSDLPEDLVVTEMSVNYRHEPFYDNPLNAPLSVIHHSWANNWSADSVTANDLVRDSVVSERTSDYSVDSWNSFTIDPDAFDWQKGLADGWLTVGITNTNTSYSHVLFYGAGFAPFVPYLEVTGSSCQ